VDFGFFHQYCTNYNKGDLFFKVRTYLPTHAHQSKILLLADSVHFVTAILLRVRHQFIADHHATRKVDKYGRYKKDMGKLDRDTYGDVSNKSCRVKILTFTWYTMKSSGKLRNEL